MSQIFLKQQVYLFSNRLCFRWLCFRFMCRLINWRKNSTL